MSDVSLVTIQVERTIVVDLAEFLPEDRNAEALAQFAGDPDWWWLFGIEEHETPTTLRATRRNPEYVGPDVLFGDPPPPTITETVTL